MEQVSDFLVIGSGIAGLSFAIKTAEHGKVTLVTKKTAADSNTNLAQGGIASVFSNLDSFDLHIKDTLEAGDGICNRKVVETVIKDGPTRIKELIRFGVEFNKKSLVQFVFLNWTLVKRAVTQENELYIPMI